MKSTVLKSLALSGLLAASSQGFSLYDTAPPIGIPESHAMQYGAYMSAGYDSNLNNTSNADREDGGFVKYGLTANYADYESASKKRLSARLGGQLYNKTANGTDQRNFSDMSISGSLSHAFSAGSSYTGSMSLTYTPNPDYSNGISSANTQGDCFSWNLSSAYSRMIDCRWSWTANVSYNGNIYTDSQYEQDDRNYLSAGLSLNLRQTTRTTYGLNMTWRNEGRSEGYDSDSFFTNLSISHSLSPTDSFSLSVGTQTKWVEGDTNLYPTLDFSYRRVLTQGLSAKAYVRYSNENIDTYVRVGNVNYRSNETWRAGFNVGYVFTPTVSFNGGASVLAANYSKGTNGGADRDDVTWTLTAGMTYRFTSSLSANLTYTYTRGDINNYADTGHYNRDVISAGLNYTF